MSWIIFSPLVMNGWVMHHHRFKQGQGVHSHGLLIGWIANNHKEGNMNAEWYHQIQQDNLTWSAREQWPGRIFIFQLDNEPKQAAKAPPKWLKNNKENVLGWRQSPHFNVVKNLWLHKKAVHARFPSNPTELELWTLNGDKLQCVQMCQLAQTQCCGGRQRCIYETPSWRGWIFMHLFTYLISHFTFSKDLFFSRFKFSSVQILVEKAV